MQRITNYQIVSSQADRLGKLVEQEMKKEWQPFGPPSFIREGEINHATEVRGYQAMVQYFEPQ
jgi:hypothetical protein